MLGFTLPLLIIIGTQTVVGVLLLCPKPINQVGILIAKASATQIGATVFHTVAGVLLLLLASPVYDGVQLMRAAKEKGDPGAAVDASDQEARTLLSFTLISACLAMMFFLRKLGLALGQLERMSVSEAAMLKQVKGLQSEYTRMVDSSGAASAGNDGDAELAPPAAGAAAGEGEEQAAELRRVAAELEQRNRELTESLERATRAQQAAESNLAAVRTQSKGVENEYDRLLGEHDELRRQLQRAGLGTPSAPDTPFAKKDE